MDTEFNKVQAEVLTTDVTTNPYMDETPRYSTNKGLKTTKKNVIGAINELLEAIGELTDGSGADARVSKIIDVVGNFFNNPDLLTKLKSIDNSLIEAVCDINVQLQELKKKQDDNSLDQITKTIEEFRSIVKDAKDTAYEAKKIAQQALSEIERISDARSTGVKKYNIVSDMIKDTGLRCDLYVETLGYFYVGDEGGATYHIEANNLNKPWAIQLDNGYYACIAETKRVTYRMFGAPLNGTDDDGQAMAWAHDYANSIYTKDETGRIFQYPVTVENHHGQIYKKNKTFISCYTNVDLSGSTLILDDNNSTWFGLYVLGDNDSNYYNYEFTPEQKAELVEDSYHFSMLDNSIPGNVAIKMDEGPYVARDDAGYMYTVNRRELLIHDMHGICASPLVNDWSDAGGRDINCPTTDEITKVVSLYHHTTHSTVSFTHIPNQRICFTGCDVLLNQGADKYCSILWVKRHNCIVKDFVMRPHRDKLRNSMFKNSMIYIWDSYNVVVQNIQGFNSSGRSDDGKKWNATSGYMVRMTNCSDVVVRDCRLLGYWGATAMDSTKNIRFERCQINRIDSHDYVSNLSIDDCIIYNHGVQVGYGTGMLSITNCAFYLKPIVDMPYPDNHLLELNLSYGRVFGGKVYINNCRCQSFDSSDYKLVKAEFSPNAVSIQPQFKFPEITIENIKVDLPKGTNLIYIQVEGSRDAHSGTTATKPRHITYQTEDNDIIWEYHGRVFDWAPGVRVEVDDVFKNAYGYFVCRKAGQLDTKKNPDDTSGNWFANGSSECRFIGVSAIWRARHKYNVNDIIVVEPNHDFPGFVYKCVNVKKAGGESNGEMPVHEELGKVVLEGTQVPLDGIPWKYIGKKANLIKDWPVGGEIVKDEYYLCGRNIYHVIQSGTTDPQTSPTQRGWFFQEITGKAVVEYVGGLWEPQMWFDLNSYCIANDNVYQCVEHYGTTTGEYPQYNNGYANDNDIIWKDLGSTKDLLRSWTAHTTYTTGTIIHTNIGTYRVVAGPCGPSMPTSKDVNEEIKDGSLIDKYIGTGDVWHASTHYDVGDIVIDNTKIYRCIVAGTSASSGWGPVELQGTIIDGQNTWETLTAVGIWRTSGKTYKDGTYFLCDDSDGKHINVYLSYPGASGDQEPTDTSGSSFKNGDIYMEFVSHSQGYPDWAEKTAYAIGDRVISNARVYECIFDGKVALPHRMMFNNIETNVSSVTPFLFKEKTSIPIRMSDDRCEIVFRDCANISSSSIPIGIAWFGLISNPSPSISYEFGAPSGADMKQIQDSISTLQTSLSQCLSAGSMKDIYRFRGNVARYEDLPAQADRGDVYNIVSADATHKLAPGANVAWNGTEWDALGGQTGTGTSTGPASYYDTITDAELDYIISGQGIPGDDPHSADALTDKDIDQIIDSN